MGARFTQSVDSHVRHMGVVIGVNREKISIDRLDVFCGRPGEHHFESLEALSVPLKCKYLSLIFHESAISRSGKEITGAQMKLTT